LISELKSTSILLWSYSWGYSWGYKKHKKKYFENRDKTIKRYKNALKSLIGGGIIPIL
jgi:hypothetical protein